MTEDKAKNAFAIDSVDPSTGTRPDVAISLLDDDDECVVLELPKKSSQNSTMETANLSTKSATETSNHDVYGCMLNPQNPIKIFATDRDKAVRRRLRRNLATIDGVVAATNGIEEKEEYRNHWSTFHCWTFREMLGFDRFSELRQRRRNQQGQKSNGKNAPVEAAVGIDWIFITTYILNVDFLLNELPELVQVPIVVILYHYKDESLSGREAAWIWQAASGNQRLVFLERNPRAMAGTATNPRGPTMDYGCHHTKMTLVRYSSGRLRVHIHTSNLRREDVHDKCQGAFLQDFWPKTEDQLGSFVTSDFEESLATYLESYDFATPLVWENPLDFGTGNDAEPLVSHLQTYDFSTAVAVLVPSVPGYHKVPRIIRRDTLTKKNPTLYAQNNDDKIFGYLKVQRAIRDHCEAKNDIANKNHNPDEGSGVIVCQFSSMGALSKPYLNKLADAWNADSLSAPSNTGASAPRSKKPKTSSRGAPVTSSHSLLKIVWPTVEEIETSVEGRIGGGSVPGRTKNLHRDFLRPLLHTWSSKSGNTKEGDLHLGKAIHVPHIKSYYQICNNKYNGGDDSVQAYGSDQGSDTMRWFVLSSHNLSKAAWGEIQYRRESETEVFVVQHWELGVFFAPSTLGVDAMGPLTSSPGATRTNANRRSPGVVESNDIGIRAIIPLPYKFRPDRYQDTDQPWVVD